MRRPEAERGSATTEVVLLTPVLLFLIMAIIQFGLWFHAQHVAQAAADQGVRTARSNGSTVEEGRQRAEDFLDAAAPTLIGDPVVVARRESDAASVTVDGTAVALVPGLSLPVHAEATSPVERFYEDDREDP
jgi:Flp pilus assembly protein TadG